jgi:cell division topological specificity factor
MKLFDWLRGKSNSSQDVAAERLRLVLTHDRANVSPGMLEMLKDEIIAVISKHMEIDADKVMVSFTEDNRETRLVADIPLQAQRGRRGAPQRVTQEQDA